MKAGGQMSGIVMARKMYVVHVVLFTFLTVILLILNPQLPLIEYLLVWRHRRHLGWAFGRDFALILVWIASSTDFLIDTDNLIISSFIQLSFPVKLTLLFVFHDYNTERAQTFSPFWFDFQSSFIREAAINFQKLRPCSFIVTKETNEKNAKFKQQGGEEGGIDLELRINFSQYYGSRS